VPKKLIEAALPLEAINVGSIPDSNLRMGHPRRIDLKQPVPRTSTTRPASVPQPHLSLGRPGPGAEPGILEARCRVASPAFSWFRPVDPVRLSRDAGKRSQTKLYSTFQSRLAPKST
jgi:hypothetical protein